MCVCACSRVLALSEQMEPDLTNQPMGGGGSFLSETCDLSNKQEKWSLLNWYVLVVSVYNEGVTILMVLAKG